MTLFQKSQYLEYLKNGQLEQAEKYQMKCKLDDEIRSCISEEEAHEKAETHVFCNMCIGDIVKGCRERGIPVSDNRTAMELALIDAIAAEYMKGNPATKEE